MARSRNIKPGFFTNDQLALCQPLARLLFEGLWCHADRAGRMEDRPRKFKAEILPYDQCDVETLLNELVVNGFVIRYSDHEAKYLQVVNFTKHQNPHIKEPPSSIPEPLKHHTSTVQTPVNNSSFPADSLILIPDSFNPSKTKTDAQKTALDFFEEAWKIYPQREGANKKQTLKAWEARIKAKVSPEVMIEGAKRYARYCIESGTESKYIKLPSVFFGTDEHFRSNWTVTTKSKLSTVVPTQSRTCTHCKEPAHMEISGRWYCRNHDQYSTSEAA